SGGTLGALHAVDRYLPWASRAGRGVARRFVPARTTSVATLRFQLGEKGIARDLHHDAELLAANQRNDQLPALVDVLDVMKASPHHYDLPRALLPSICTIWGAANRVLSPRAGERLSEPLGAERAEVLAGCGHLPMLEDPEAVTHIIDEFAQSI